MAPTYGYQSQLGIDTANPTTKRFDFQEEELVLDEEFLDMNGLRGTRSRDISRVAQNIRRCHGPIVFQPDAVELALLLPWALCGTPSGSPTVTYPLADALVTRFVQIDRGSKVFTYNSVGVDRMTIRGAQAQPLVITLDLVGIDETLGNAGTFPVLSIDTANTPFIFTELVLNVGGTNYAVPGFELIVDNAIDKERFFNSQTLTAVNGTDRHVLLNLEPPYGDASALYGTSAAGITATATFTNGNAILTLSMTKVAFPRHSPRVRGRSEVMFPIQGVCYKSAGTLELVTTLNPGP